MNREIKFRAYDIENKEMLEVTNLMFDGELYIKVEPYSDYFNENEMILMQYVRT